MSKRRHTGEWVRLMPNAGFVSESDRLPAEIMPDGGAEWCVLCDDPDCYEWATLLTAPDPQNKGERYMLFHVNECQMQDLEP